MILLGHGVGDALILPQLRNVVVQFVEDVESDLLLLHY